jgi:hypothetical protein
MNEKVMGPLPNFLVVGAQRCGTTYLHGLLQQHPEVFLPEGKEIHFFDHAEALGGEVEIKKYMRHFNAVRAQKAIGEITPSYMYVNGVPELILRYLDGVRLIFLLRNPLERAYSHYWFNVSERREHFGFEEALAQEDSRISKGFPDNLLFSYIDRGRYMRQIERFLSIFPQEKMLFLIAEEMFANPRESLTGICRFLGITESYAFDVAVNRNRKQLPKYISAYLMMRSLSRIAANAPDILGFHKTVEHLSRSIPMTERPYPKMKKETRRWLRSVFDEDIRKVAGFLGRDLDVWQ